MTRRSKLAVFLSIFSLVFILSGCSVSEPDDVKLASAGEILDWASGKYGEAEYLDTVREAVFEHVYLLRDKDTGIEYEAYAIVRPSGSGENKIYSASRESDFETRYSTYLLDAIASDAEALKSGLRCEFEMPEAIRETVFVTVLNECEDVDAVAAAIGDMIAKHDVKEKLDEICVSGVDGDVIGSYSIRTKLYRTAIELEREEFMQAAASQNYIKRDEITFLRTEDVIVGNIDGLDMTEVVTVVGRDPVGSGDTVKAYFFQYDGEEYVIYDVPVGDGDEYYCNYKSRTKVSLQSEGADGK